MAQPEPITTAGVATLLGGKRVLKRALTAPLDMHATVRDGLPFDALDAVVQTLGLPVAEVTKVLGLAPRTLARRKEQHILTPAESDRLYRLARVACLAMEVLGAADKARQWLERPNRALGGETPLHLLDTDIGVRQVEAVLGRINHGVFS
jgi:putative toxin-antitoxin system antitoxin component (TIGR02293 family)